MAPITIRAVVQAFKDRIHTERDKTEFKALCDKYTVVRWMGQHSPAGPGALHGCRGCVVEIAVDG